MSYDSQQTWEQPQKSRLTKNVGRSIASFVRSFTYVLWACMAMAIVGFLLKVFAVAAGNFVFLFAMAVLTLLCLVQVGLSFVYVVVNVRLALMGAVSSVALVFSLLALMFRYQIWSGAQIMYLIALPLFLLAVYLMVKYIAKQRELAKPQGRFLYYNLLLPYLFVLLLTIASLVLDVDTLNTECASCR